MPWAPEDWRGSSIRGFAVMNGDHILRVTYLELLFYFWTHGGTHPSDPLRVAATVGIPLDEATRAISALLGLGALVEAGGLLSNVRVTSDLREDAEFREERAKAGSKDGQKATSAQANLSSAQAQLKQTEAQPDPPSPSPSPSPIKEPPLPPLQGGFDLEPVAPVTKAPRAKKAKAAPLTPAPGFDEFWAAYPKKEGKKEAIEVWNGMTRVDREAATVAAPMYAAAMAGKDRDYIKFPQGWLNARRFEDEVAPAVQAPLAPLTEKQKWEKRKDAEAALWDGIKAKEREETRAEYRATIDSMAPEKRERLLTVILPEIDPEFAAELSAKGYR